MHLEHGGPLVDIGKSNRRNSLYHVSVNGSDGGVCGEILKRDIRSVHAFGKNSINDITCHDAQVVCPLCLALMNQRFCRIPASSINSAVSILG